MKFIDRCLVGETVSVINFTEGWYAVSVHPTTFYRRIDEFHETLKHSRGHYAEIDFGETVQIKFSNHVDMIEFKRRNNEYV